MTTLPIILNPAAGGGRCGERAEAAIARLRAGGVQVEVHRTQGPGHATELVRQIRSAGTHRMLCAGGDGTTYEVVNGLFPHAGDAPRPVLGMLPLGTGNSFLKDFDLQDADAAIAAVLSGRTKVVDVVEATHTQGSIHYLNLLSIGFTSEVGRTTNRWFKPLGEAGYAVATVLEVARLRAQPFPHSLDGGPLDTTPYAFISFSNSRCTGGDMQMAPDADPGDGQLDAIYVGDLGRVGLLRAFPSIFEGTHVLRPGIHQARAARVDLALSTPLAVMVDGEVVTLQLQRLDVRPGALEVMA